jgi:hypothetical protein
LKVEGRRKMEDGRWKMERVIRIEGRGPELELGRGKNRKGQGKGDPKCQTEEQAAQSFGGVETSDVILLSLRQKHRLLTCVDP